MDNINLVEDTYMPPEHPQAERQCLACDDIFWLNGAESGCAWHAQMGRLGPNVSQTPERP